MWKIFLLVSISATFFIPQFFNWYFSISISEADNEYDFVVVGGGTSGSVVANRLSEVKKWRVLLLEAGGEDQPNLKISIPLLYSWTQNTATDWQYISVPQKHACQMLNNKQNMWPRGKVLGGTSAINSMVYVRGSPHDYDLWEKNGATGWGYKNVLHYFKKLEDASALNVTKKHHGFSGPLKLSYPHIMPISKAFVDAGVELGFHSGDYNQEDALEGFHYVQATIARGRRQYASQAYLRPIASSRSNLHILVRSHVKKIILKNSESGEIKATGVTYVKNGQEHQVRARKEVILSAGSIGTPQILMLSGIGQEQQLRDMKIDPIVNLPGVGENLQDHVALSVCWAGNNITTDDVIEGQSDILRKLMHYYFSSDFGPLASNAGAEAHAMLRTNSAPDLRPDLQLLIDTLRWENKKYVAPPTGELRNIQSEYYKRMETFAKQNNRTTACDFTITNIALRSYSVGNIRLSSNNFKDKPRIDPNYLSDERDLDILLHGFRVMENMEDTEAFQRLGAHINLLFDECKGQVRPRSRKCLETAIRHLTRTIYHPVGTAKMGTKNDQLAVVDPRLRVRGVENLRVADASIMPVIVSANTQAACYMIGEKAGDLIKEENEEKIS